MGKRPKHAAEKKGRVKERSEKKKMSNMKRTVLISVGIIILIIVGTITAIIARYNYESLDLNNLGINKNPLKIDNKDKYINIALFGVDSRANSFEGLSDSIMVATLDYEHKKIKLTSFMRDSLVKIEGYGYEKQTHAHAYGGDQLSVKTLNTNYDLDIEEYITINFLGLEKIINKIGGITVDVKSYEVNEINKYINELNKINGGDWVAGLSGSGEQKLSGRQAVSYARIRKVGNGDEQRTDRQREVIEKIIEKLFKLDYAKLTSLAYEFMPYVKTSFTAKEIIDIAIDYNTFKDAKVEQFRYPAEYGFVRVNGMSTVRPLTLESNVKKIHEFIYEMADYEVSDTVKEISRTIESY